MLLYAGSAQFYFFNAQFSYQTVAIAMLMAALYLLVRAFDSEEERPWRLLIAVQVCLGGLAITHHLTSWLMLVLLWLLALFFWRGGEERRARLTLITAELATVVVLAWTAIIAPLLISYLGPDLRRGQQPAAHRPRRSPAAGARRGRRRHPHAHLGADGDGRRRSCCGWRCWSRPPGGPGGAAASARPGRATSRWPSPWSIPALQLARFAPSAAEVADRASTFVTMAMALVVAAWLAPRIQIFAALVVPGLVMLILGGTLIGSGPDWQRVPGPYLAGAEQRSIDSESVAVAQWAGTYLPEGSRVAADSTFTRLLPNFAPVTTITQPAGFDSMTPLFIAHSVDQEVLRLILQNDVDFIVVDTRLVGQTVRSGGFFEGSTGYGPDAQTIKRDQVQKFEDQPGFDLVLDGPVKVYDVRPLRHAEQTFADRDPPGLPGGWTPWQVLATGMLLLIGLLARGRLLDPRRFRARDVWRPAVTLPAAMVFGVGRGAGRLQPARRPDRRLGAALRADPAQLAARSRSAAAGAAAGRGASRSRCVVAATVGLAIWAAWHGLLDHAVLPPPAVGGDGVMAEPYGDDVVTPRPSPPASGRRSGPCSPPRCSPRRSGWSSG